MHVSPSPPLPFYHIIIFQFRRIYPLLTYLPMFSMAECVQVKLNTDESPGVATEYGIRSIPTCMIFKGGQKVDTVIGAVPKSTLVGTIDKYLD